jgi:hypothetical protein
LQNFDLPLDNIFSLYFQENCDLNTFSSLQISLVAIDMKESSTILIEISLGKFIYINSQLDSSKQKQLIKMLKKHIDAFAWRYQDMKGIHPDTCTHNIYIQENA